MDRVLLDDSLNIIKSCAVKLHKAHDKLSTLDAKVWEKTANGRK